MLFLFISIKQGVIKRIAFKYISQTFCLTESKSVLFNSDCYVTRYYFEETVVYIIVHMSPCCNSEHEILYTFYVSLREINIT